MRVVPEFDTPGHTYPAWGKGGPERLLTTCESGGIDGVGALRVDLESTYKFLESLFHEIARVFPDPFFHVGGDEVNGACWLNNSDVKAFLASKGWDVSELIPYYMKRLLEMTSAFSEQSAENCLSSD